MIPLLIVGWLAMGILGVFLLGLADGYFGVTENNAIIAAIIFGPFSVMMMLFVLALMGLYILGKKLKTHNPIKYIYKLGNKISNGN